MTKINLLRKSTAFDKISGSYRMSLEVLSTENIDRNVFIKQRLRNFVKNNFDDVFVGVSTPSYLEELDKDSPGTGTAFYRTYSIDLVSRNAAYLDDVFESILVELQKLCDDYASLEDMEPDAIYQITAGNYGARTYQDGGITVNPALTHVHYRLPLIAEPCGTNEIFVVEGLNFHRVGSQDTNKSGWLNCVPGTDPDGYKFKYNIDKDTALHLLWPPPSNKVQYAHLEVEGVTTDNILINTEGVYWKYNGQGDAPWPIDYVSHSNPSPSGQTLSLVLDIIV